MFFQDESEKEFRELFLELYAIIMFQTLYPRNYYLMNNKHINFISSSFLNFGVIKLKAEMKLVQCNLLFCLHFVDVTKIYV